MRTTFFLWFTPNLARFTLLSLAITTAGLLAISPAHAQSDLDLLDLLDSIDAQEDEEVEDGDLGSATSNTNFLALIDNEEEERKDPWKEFNQDTFAYNNKIDRNSLKPLASAYQTVTPGFVRRGVNNFFSNLQEPTNFIWNLAQGKVRRAFVCLLRLVINSTIGIGGFVDVANAMGLPRYAEDFGQTLGAWGIGPGPYFVVPFLGPSSLRDAPALAIDFYIDYTSSPFVDLQQQLTVFRLIVARERLLGTESIAGSYENQRDAYLQLRAYNVRDGREESTNDEDWVDALDDLDDLDSLEDLEDWDGYESQFNSPDNLSYVDSDSKQVRMATKLGLSTVSIPYSALPPNRRFELLMGDAELELRMQMASPHLSQEFNLAISEGESERLETQRASLDLLHWRI